MKLWQGLLAAVLSASVLAGCGGGSDDPESQLRVLHGSPDAPNVDIYVRGERIAADVPYKAALPYQEVRGGPVGIRVTVAGTQNDVISAVPDLADGRAYTLIAADRAASIQPLLIQDESSDVPAGNARLRVVHAAPSAPAVDIYVTAPDADLAMATPTLVNVSFRDVAPALPVPAGNYQIRVTPTGTRNAVYDSGRIALAAGQDLMPVALDQAQGLSPITLVVLPAEGSSFELKDIRSQVRVIHASPDAPAVDILVDNRIVLSNVPYPTVSPYLDLPAATYNVKVNAAGTATTVIDADAPLKPSEALSVLATGFLAGIAPLVTTDDLAVPPAGQAKLRVIHASPDAPNVDVFANGNRILADVPFRTASGYLVVPAGAYNVEVKVANTPTVVLAANVTLETRRIYSAIAIGSVAGGPNPLALNLVTDR